MNNLLTRMVCFSGKACTTYQITFNLIHSESRTACHDFRLNINKQVYCFIVKDTHLTKWLEANCCPDDQRFIWTDELWGELRKDQGYEEDQKQIACRHVSIATSRLGWPVQFKRRRGKSKILGLTWLGKRQIILLSVY